MRKEENEKERTLAWISPQGPSPKAASTESSDPHSRRAYNTRTVSTVPQPNPFDTPVSRYAVAKGSRKHHMIPCAGPISVHNRKERTGCLEPWRPNRAESRAVTHAHSGFFSALAGSGLARGPELGCLSPTGRRADCRLSESRGSGETDKVQTKSVCTEYFAEDRL